MNNLKKRYDDPEQRTDYLLEQWGLWRRHGTGIPVYISPAYVMLRDNMGGVVKTGMISDDVALLIDGIVARLCVKDAGMGGVIWLYYGAGLSYRQIGRHMGIGHTNAKELVKSGTAWIDGVRFSHF